MACEESNQAGTDLASRMTTVLVRFWDSVTLRILLLASTVGLTLWVLWGPALRHAHLYPQFGDLSGWAQSAGSFAAVVVALVQSRRLQIARIEDLRRQEEHERTQVYGWVAYRQDGTGSGGWWVYLNNMTPTPIGVWVMRIDDAETGRQVTLDVSHLLPILPGFTQRPAGVAPGDLLHPMCRLEFADATGVCWQRDASGRLGEIPEIRLGDQILATSTRTGSHHGR